MLQGKKKMNVEREKPFNIHFFISARNYERMVNGACTHPA